MTELITTYLPIAMLVVGLLAFAVSVIVEVLKNISILEPIPTDLIVILLSMVITVLALFAYSAYANLVLTWYMIVGAIIVGFFVAFIAMYGWDKLTTLYARFKQ